LLRSVFVKEERVRERERERDYVFIIIIKLSKAFFVQRQQRVKHPFLLLPLTTEEDVFFLKTFYKRDFFAHTRPTKNARRLKKKKKKTRRRRREEEAKKKKCIIRKKNGIVYI
jgi:hypothetical protein